MKNNIRRVDSEEGRCDKKGTTEKCDVGFARDRTFEVVGKTEVSRCTYIWCK